MKKLRVSKKVIASGIILSLGLTTISNNSLACENENGSDQYGYKEVSHIDKTKLICKNKKKYGLKDCTSLSVYLFKAKTNHILQDLTYYNSFEVSKKKLIKGAYYEVVYSHDIPVKSFLIKPKTQKQREILNIMYDSIKSQQQENKYDLAKEYKEYKKSFKNSKYSYYSIYY